MQKFNKGDLVHIAADLGEMMSHFPKDKQAIVMYSYHEKYGCGKAPENNQYSLHIEGMGESSWYYDKNLTLIATNQMHLLQQWEGEKEAKDKLHYSHEWIFSEVDVEEVPGPSLQRLADDLNLGSLWGTNGEGITYYINSVRMLKIALPFLVSRDLEGWLSFAEKNKK